MQTKNIKELLILGMLVILHTFFFCYYNGSEGLFCIIESVLVVLFFTYWHFDNKHIKEQEALEEELRQLRHYKDSSEGLICIDRNPSEVTYEWILEHSFELKY